MIRSLNLAPPVAIVFAYREYEAWFLATLSSIAGHYDLPSDVVYEGDVEAKRNVKGWLKAQMRQGIAYNPVIHQKKFTSLIDIEVAYEGHPLKAGHLFICHSSETANLVFASQRFAVSEE